MSFARFCALFLRNLRKTGSIFCKFLLMKRKEFCAIFFAQNRKYYAKCNFMCKLTRIEILSTELDNYLLNRKNLIKSTIKLLLIGFVLVSGIVMWARLYLQAHTEKEVYTGFLLGFATTSLVLLGL